MLRMWWFIGGGLTLILIAIFVYLGAGQARRAAWRR
jgi:hypothetical protein